MITKFIIQINSCVGSKISKEYDKPIIYLKNSITHFKRSFSHIKHTSLESSTSIHNIDVLTLNHISTSIL